MAKKFQNKKLNKSDHIEQERSAYRWRRVTAEGLVVFLKSALPVLQKHLKNRK